MKTLIDQTLESFVYESAEAIDALAISLSETILNQVKKMKFDRQDN